MSGWRDEALCANAPDADLWFPDRGDRATAAAARRICGMCPVRAQCLAFAIVARPEDGIWAGLDARPGAGELQAIIAARGRPRPCFVCGTVFVPADRAHPAAYCCEEHRAAARRAQQTACDRRAHKRGAVA